MVVAPKTRTAKTVHSQRLIELRPHSMPWSSIAGFSTRLGVGPAELLRIIGISERTAIRRKAEGYLKPDEADRLLRVGRIFAEATRILGAEDRATGWLNDPNPMFGDATPLSFLDSDAGAQAVNEELGRIDYGIFA
jgi:putative toxin-antitoxin system antitoxin component (TIGR02293 family)